MKFNNKLNELDVTTTSRSNKMTFSKRSESMLFNLMTGDLYSDPIGSFIREIASNCFDSHVEAGTDTTKNPVVITLQNNSNFNEQSYISFIDKGIGMNPERFTNIYANYFETTKDNTNSLIGGFGLGGKTPLAYSPKGFFVITVADKNDEIKFSKNKIELLNSELSEIEDEDVISLIKEEIKEYEHRLLTVSNINNDRIEYTYNVFVGNDAPEYQLMSYKGTDAHKGTEIKIPIKNEDIDNVERKTLRQLYYFENIIFKGFSDNHVTNDYNIVRGKNFLYRGNEYDSYIHICFGKVAYPIDYNAMGISQYNYNIPIAVKIEIGELEGTGVTPSREAINYSDANIGIIKNKIDAALDELKTLLEKQYESIVTLSDYYKLFVDNFGSLYLRENDYIYLGNIIKKQDVNLENFKYKKCPSIISHSEILKQFFNIKMFGDRVKKNGSKKVFNETVDHIAVHGNVLHVKDEFKRINLKQSYLKHLHGERFYILIPKKLTERDYLRLMIRFGLVEEIHYSLPYDIKIANERGMSEYYKFKNISKKKAFSLINSIIKEIVDIVHDNTPDYDSVIVDDNFIQKRSRERKLQKQAFEKDSLNVRYANYSGNYTLTFKELNNHKGTIIYGFRDDSTKLNDAYSFANELNVITYSRYKNKYGMMFIQISQGNEKYMKALGRKAYHVDDFYKRFVCRKVDNIIEFKTANIISNKFENVHRLFGNTIMKDVNYELYDNYYLIKNNIPNNKTLYYINYSKLKNDLGIDLNNDNIKFKYQKELDTLNRISDKLSNKLEILNIYALNDDNREFFIKLIKFCLSN